MAEPCPVCVVLREEVAFLREMLKAARQQPVAPLAPVPDAIAGTGDAKIDLGMFMDPHTGLAMMLYDGKPVPVIEHLRGLDGIDAAVAGRAVVIPDPNAKEGAQ